MATDEKKLFRSRDTLTLRDVRVMKVDEPRELNDETTLCSFSVVSQPGNDKDMDQWIRVTGKNGLAERIYQMQPGDRVNVAGKPFFSSYEDKDGNTRLTVEIKFPEYVDFLTKPTEKPEADKGEVEEVVEEAPVKVDAKTEAKRGRGRPRKNSDELPFE